MKKKIISTFVIIFFIIFIGLFLIVSINKIYWKKEHDKFNYNKALKTTTKYLNKNENELKKIADILLETKESKEKPYKNIKFAKYFKDFDFKGNGEYIKFNIDSQGMLGGQYYGLIYIQDKFDELITYDGTKLENENNIFIREKLKDNWYFYYDDYDGKVNIDKIRKD